MKKRVALTVLVVGVLAVGVWYFTLPQPAPGSQFISRESLPLNPEPADGSELLTLRKPLKETIIYPGLHLGDNTGRLEFDLRRSGVQLTTHHDIFLTSYGVEFRMNGRLFGMQKAMPLILDEVDNRGSLWWVNIVADDLSTDEARSIYNQWIAHIEKVLGHGDRRTFRGGQEDTYNWHDDQASLTLIVNSPPRSETRSVEITFSIEGSSAK